MSDNQNASGASPEPDQLPDSTAPGLPADSASDTPGELDRTANVLLQASQLTEHLRSQFAELNRREQNLASQLGQLDHERRALRLWSQELIHQADQREADVRDQEAQLKQKTAACERLVQQLERQKSELANERQKLEIQRSQLKAEIERDLDDDRETLRSKQAELQASQAAHAREREREQAEHRQLLAQLDAEQRELRQQLRDEFLQQKQLARKEILEELDLQKTQLERWQHEWAERQARENDELERARHECRAALAKERADWEQELTQSKSDLEARRQLQDEALRQHEAEWQADFEARQQAAETELWETIDRTRAVTTQAEQEIAAERQELEKQQALFEGRTRFQMSHLTTAREEFEQERKAFRLETQQAIAQLEELEEQQRLARQQFERRHRLLSERENSLARERAQLERIRRENERHVEIIREQLADRQQAWERDKTLQESELRRQQDILSLHAENLEARRERLDRLRAELEESHRDSLELRIALEEASAQLQQAIGVEPAQERIEQAREALSEYYHHLRQGLADQRRELQQEQTRFEERKDEFRAERQKLMEWIAERDRTLAEQEQRAHASQQELDNIRGQWVQAQQKWSQERSSAESIIRDLLKQLDESDQRPLASHAAETRRRFEKCSDARQAFADLPGVFRPEPSAADSPGEANSTLSGPHTRPGRPNIPTAVTHTNSRSSQASIPRTDTAAVAHIEPIGNEPVVNDPGTNEPSPSEAENADDISPPLSLGNDSGTFTRISTSSGAADSRGDALQGEKPSDGCIDRVEFERD